VIWPHETSSASRIRTFRILCAASVLLACCWRGVSLAERFLVLVMGLYGLISGFLAYGLVLFLVRTVPVHHRFMAVFVAGFNAIQRSAVGWRLSGADAR
jgi:hypothetical protein